MNLSYYHNDKYMGIAYDTIDVAQDIKYKMALHLMSQNTKVRLISIATM